MKRKTNVAKGVKSKDEVIDNVNIAFINHNTSEYPVTVGTAKFEPVPVTKQKDLMLNVARLHAQQEYDRIMELVSVLQKQAKQIMRRLEFTDMVHSAEYSFQIFHGQCYWLVLDRKTNKYVLAHLGPNDWSSGAPDNLQYITRVKWLGDHTWQEVDSEGNPINENSFNY
jgi:hypothetical protein